MLKDRNYYAQQLARIAMKLQRTKEADQDKLLVAADRALQGYKSARIQETESFGEVISPEVAEGLEPTLQALAEVIKDALSPLGFTLLAFSEEDDGSGRVSYVSNCHREDTVKAMREFIVAHESQQASG